MKKLILTIVLLVSMIAGKSQTTFWINNIVSGPGQVVIPVYVIGFDTIGAVVLDLGYSTNLTYVGYQNLNTQFQSPSILDFTTIYGTNKIRFTSCSPECNMSIPDSSIAFELKFNFSGGMGTLIWDTTTCVIGNSGGEPILLTLINGYINTSVGINEIGHPIIRCFPNPTTDIVNFISVVKDFRLYNTCGQLLLSDKDVQKVDLTSFGKGVYIAEIDDSITKIVKQ